MYAGCILGDIIELKIYDTNTYFILSRYLLTTSNTNKS